MSFPSNPPSAESVSIRELTAAEEAALVRFFLENDRPEITDYFYAFPLTAEVAARICREPRQDRYFALFAAGEIVGMAMLRGWDEGFEIPSFGVMVDHRHQGRGLGKRLTMQALEIARAMGAARVRLTVLGSRTAVVALYERCGFRADGAEVDGRLVMFAEVTKKEV